MGICKDIRLYSSFFEVIVGEGHNSIDDGDEYWNKISEFLTKQEASIQN